MQRDDQTIINKAVLDHYIRETLISKIKKRFSSYGYQQIRTSSFENYDMYASIKKTVNMDEMIKVIHPSGKVLVLRPDGTIPITRMTATNSTINGSIQRLFYIMDVFRHSNSPGTEEESTQAGVELFGSNTAEADAEVIMLAIHSLKDIGFADFKIEIGHAGLFKELIEQTELNKQELELLQEYIHSKNMVEMKPFLEKLNIREDLKEALHAIPLLYGEPEEILERSKKIIRNEKMQEVLNNLFRVISVLEDYETTDYITLNLGLINNMDYYTDIIFQGFIENIGSPILMGGRYDSLGKQFGKNMAAIGFAYGIDYLLKAMKKYKLNEKASPKIPLTLYYETNRRRQAIAITNYLREQAFPVIAASDEQQRIKADIKITEKSCEVRMNGKIVPFRSTEELVSMLQQLEVR